MRVTKMGKNEGMTRRDRMGEVVEIEDTDEEEIDEERNDILVVKKDKVKEKHSLGGYFTKRRRFLGEEREEMGNQVR